MLISSLLGPGPGIPLAALIAFCIFFCGQSVSGKDSSAEYEKEMSLAAGNFQNGNIQSAFGHCNRALTLKPNSTDALLIRGWLLLNANKAERAIAEFTKVLKIDPKNVNAYKSRGLVYRQLKEADLSTKDLAKAMELDPQDVESNYLHGISNILDGNHRRALLDFNNAIKFGTNHPRLNHLYYWRGRTKQMLGDHQGAVLDLSKCRDLSRSNFKNQPKPGEKYRLSHLMFRVAVFTQKADSVFGVLERAASYMELGDYKKAAEDYTSSIKHTPDDVLMYEERGVAYLLDGQYQKSQLDFNKALLNGSHSTDLYLRMAVNQFCRGNYKRVPSTLKTWFAREGYVSDSSPLAIAIAYTSYIRSKQFKKAHEFLVEVGEKIPRKEKWHARCYRVFKNSLCGSDFQKLAAEPDSKNWSRVHTLAGLFYSLTKNSKEATKEFGKVLKTPDRKALELAIAKAELQRTK